MSSCLLVYYFVFFFFNDTATTEIYTLSLHDALPISPRGRVSADVRGAVARSLPEGENPRARGRRRPPGSPQQWPATCLDSTARRLLPCRARPRGHRRGCRTASAASPPAESGSGEARATLFGRRSM